MTAPAGYGPQGARGGVPGRSASVRPTSILGADDDPHAQTVYAPEEGGFHDGLDPSAYSTAEGRRSPVKTALHTASALGSLALVGWVAIWGYGQVVRDVTGVPVVAALDGPMRTAPVDPGGQVSDLTGFAVNQVKAVGTAAPASDAVRLAPGAPALAEEDAPMPELEPRPVPRPAATADATVSPEPAPAPEPAIQPAGEPLLEARLEVDPGTVETAVAPATEQGADMLTTASDAADTAAQQVSDAVAAALAEALTEGLQPLTEDASAGANADTAPVLTGPGLVRSLRPVPRPARSGAAVIQASAQLDVPSRAALIPASAVASISQDPAVGSAYDAPLVDVTPGMRLVQLGAFDTVEDARAEWATVSARFAPLMEGKGLVVEEAQAGDRSFYRLRAAGFADLGQARRFCAALVAERAECIPVVAR